MGNEEYPGEKKAREKMEVLESTSVAKLFEVLKEEIGLFLNAQDTFDVNFDQVLEKIGAPKEADLPPSVENIEDPILKQAMLNYGNSLLLGAMLTRIVSIQGEILKRLSCMAKEKGYGSPT